MWPLLTVCLLLSITAPLHTARVPERPEPSISRTVNSIYSPDDQFPVVRVSRAAATKEQRQVRKELRKKKKRLRELREEIRVMSKFIMKTDGNSTVVRSSNRRDSRDERKWRRRMLERMDIIVRRLDRLEQQIPTTTDSPKTSTIAMSRLSQKKMNKHLASISRSLNGQNGTHCESHKDCRPGRCCHLHPRGGSAECVYHALTESAICEDSCQCAAQLNCFASNATSTTMPACKQATSSDIKNGRYLIAPHGVFPASKPPGRR